MSKHYSSQVTEIAKKNEGAFDLSKVDTFGALTLTDSALAELRAAESHGSKMESNS
jgi:hypothetical protein